MSLTSSILVVVNFPAGHRLDKLEQQIEKMYLIEKVSAFVETNPTEPLKERQDKTFTVLPVQICSQELEKKNL